MPAASPPDSPVAASGGCFACFSRPAPPRARDDRAATASTTASGAAATGTATQKFMRVLSAHPPPARVGSQNLSGYSLPRSVREANASSPRVGPALCVQPLTFRKPDPSHATRARQAPASPLNSQSLGDADASAHVLTDYGASSKRSSGLMKHTGGGDDATRSGGISAAMRAGRTTESRGHESMDEVPPLDTTGGPPVRVLHTSEVSTLGTLTVRVARTMDQPDQRQRLATAVSNMALSHPPELFNERYLLLNETVQGGQALVVFARDASGAFEQYAIKFFHKRDEYEAEARLYEHAQLRKTLPRLVAAVDNEEGAVRSHGGFRFPPYIVLARGVTLAAWAQTPRRFGAVINLMESLTDLLAILHGAGCVHRDLKPGNALVQMDSQEWCLIDFGIVAKAGLVAHPRCTLMYAPPEITLALEEEVPIAIAGSHDIWSLGVILYEVISGNPAFSVEAKVADCFACAAGDKLYPWELPLDEQPAAWRHSRLQAGVLRCLQRDASLRPSAQELKRDLRRLGATTATTLT